MAFIMNKRGQQDNVATYEFICDTLEDLYAIKKQDIVMGSVAIVISGDAGLEVYMANGQKNWINIGAPVADEEESEP